MYFMFACVGPCRANACSGDPRQRTTVPTPLERYQDRAPHAATADFAPLPGVAGGGGASARLPRRAVVRGSHMTDAHDAAPAARGRPDDNTETTTLSTRRCIQRHIHAPLGGVAGTTSRCACHVPAHLALAPPLIISCNRAGAPAIDGPCVAG